eukprot:TRINITY_DN25074_c0_g1_i1.p1 TRINITY_DN25074_c0_g1~~TRINITY_DN25074_c0_g1_i1.p1  ORF type:complete len:116 (+),score=8.53 TRINITY_DN25074_c0_g1_i1:3-350(+)
MIQGPPRYTQSRSSAASDVYKRQALLYALLYENESGRRTQTQLKAQSIYFNLYPSADSQSNSVQDIKSSRQQRMMQQKVRHALVFYPESSRTRFLFRRLIFIALIVIEKTCLIRQ